MISLENNDLSFHFYSNVPYEGFISKLFEEVDGKKSIKTSEDNYPKSIISAAKRFK